MKVSPRVAEVISRAEAYPFIDTGHLLIAIAESDGVARRMLANLGISAAILRNEYDSITPSADGPIDHSAFSILALPQTVEVSFSDPCTSVHRYPELPSRRPSDSGERSKLVLSAQLENTLSVLAACLEKFQEKLQSVLSSQPAPSSPEHSAPDLQENPPLDHIQPSPSQPSTLPPPSDCSGSLPTNSDGEEIPPADGAA